MPQTSVLQPLEYGGIVMDRNGTQKHPVGRIVVILTKLNGGVTP